MSNFTPRPWKALLEGGDRHGDVVSADYTIVHVDTRYGRIGEPEANARLIAQSPDLFEIVEKAIENGWLPPTWARLAAEAIEKVEG
jgi:hypothetical protein